MGNKLFNSLHLKGFLSFAPNAEAVELTALNVLIGPNGAGKSNFLEAVELLHAAPTDLPDAIRTGGRPMDWVWKGEAPAQAATIDARLAACGDLRELLYRVSFTERGSRVEIVDETLEETTKKPGEKDVFFYYRFQDGRPVINVRQLAKGGPGRRYVARGLERQSISPEQSVLKQKRDSDHYPELFETARRFEAIQIFREWSFGRSAGLRQPQPADLPTESLLPNLRNLGLVLNSLQHTDRWTEFEKIVSSFLPRFNRLSTKIEPGGAVQIYLHELGVRSPLPATRLSDGTLRFISLLAILINADSASLLCIEEPELGLHPDVMAVLADLLVEASKRTQVVVTTHSDVLVSALTEQAESVLVCDYQEGRGSVFRRLEAQKLAFWLEKYRLGEVWRLGKLGGNLW